MNKYRRDVRRGGRGIAREYGGEIEIIEGHPHGKVACRCRGQCRTLPLSQSQHEGRVRLKLKDIRRAFEDMLEAGQ